MSLGFPLSPDCPGGAFVELFPRPFPLPLPLPFPLPGPLGVVGGDGGCVVGGVVDVSGEGGIDVPVGGVVPQNSSTDTPAAAAASRSFSSATDWAARSLPDAASDAASHRPFFAGPLGSGPTGWPVGPVVAVVPTVAGGALAGDGSEVTSFVDEVTVETDDEDVMDAEPDEGDDGDGFVSMPTAGVAWGPGGGASAEGAGAVATDRGDGRRGPGKPGKPRPGAGRFAAAAAVASDATDAALIATTRAARDRRLRRGGAPAAACGCWIAVAKASITALEQSSSASVPGDRSASRSASRGSGPSSCCST